MRLLGSLLLSLLILAAAPAASAGGWYVEAMIGANFPDDVAFGTDAGAIETSLDDGYLWGFGFGYQFAHVRLNAELDTSREADVGVHSLDGIEQAGSRGDVQSEAGMANVLFDFNKDKRISPYVMRYYATGEGDFDTTPAAGGQRIQVDYSAFSVTAGFRYEFCTAGPAGARLT